MTLRYRNQSGYIQVRQRRPGVGRSTSCECMRQNEVPVKNYQQEGISVEYQLPARRQCRQFIVNKFEHVSRRWGPL